MGFFKKIKEGLKKTRDAVVGQIDSMLKSFTKIDDELFEELEDAILEDELGVDDEDEPVPPPQPDSKTESVTNNKILSTRINYSLLTI